MSMNSAPKPHGPSNGPEKQPNIYEDIDGKRVVATGETESEGVRLGDVLSLEPGADTSNTFKDVKEIKVVGFDDLGDAILQLDGGRVFVSSPAMITLSGGGHFRNWGNSSGGAQDGLIGK